VAGHPEDGRRTSLLGSHKELATEMNDFLKMWRKQNPPAAPRPHKQAISDVEMEQLRALGYVD
jgi:hypothetical protein